MENKLHAILRHKRIYIILGKSIDAPVHYTAKLCRLQPLSNHLIILIVRCALIKDPY